MKKRRILVFPCGSEIGLELYRSLCFAKEVELFGGSSVSDHGRFVYENYINNIPFATEPSFITHINKLITEYNINYILPAHDSIILQLAKSQHKGELFCPVITSPLETCSIVRSKKQTIEIFRGIIRTPYVYDDISQITEFPVFLKPDIGQGSKGTIIANCKEEVQFHISKNPNLLILEYLPGAEYTVDCYTNNNGELIFCGGRQRCRISNGISVNTKPVNIKDIEEIAMKINKRLRLQGMWFFQLKETKGGDLALLEIAPRMAGTMGMYRNLGVNFALINLYELEGYKVTAMPNTFDIEMDRALCSRFKLNISYKHVYVDFDDCLLINQKINTHLISFLYQCINEGIKINLLTRHAEEIHNSLSKYRMISLFDSIIPLQNGERKSHYIQHEESIFIDDSFRERAEVKSICKIPVFATDAIESLLK